MQNQLVNWLEEKRGGLSIRQEAKELGVSHAHLAKIIKGERPVTWLFAAMVAEKKGLPAITAFEMAGLLPVGGPGSEVGNG
jgi:transcriptional regulator with XRE-family HTH domain